MQTFKAESKNLKISPRKVRLVVDGVKDMKINAAIAVLAATSKRAGIPVKKALESAIANAVHNGNVDKNDLFISEMFVNEGVAYKRYHFAARGRIRPYQKKTSHLKVILGVQEKEEVKVAKAEAVKSEEKEMKEKKSVKKGKGEGRNS